MRLSELNEYIEFWQITNATTKRNGDRTGTEAKVYGCWANVQQLSGQQRLYAEQLQSGTPYTVTIKYTKTLTITPDMKIIWRGKRMTIQPPTADTGKWDWIKIPAYIDGQENIPNYRQQALPSPTPDVIITPPPTTTGSGTGVTYTKESATNWVVVHNRGYRPAVSCVDHTGEEISPEVKHISLNEVHILHRFNQAGTVYII